MGFVKFIGYSGMVNVEGVVSRGIFLFAFVFRRDSFSKFFSFVCICTMLLMIMGRMFRGKRRMLNKVKDTKVFWVFRMLFSSMVT